MTPRIFPRVLPRMLPLAIALAIGLVAPQAGADEVRVERAGTDVMAPRLQPSALDLLPLDDYERTEFNAKHGKLWYRTQAITRQMTKLRKQIAGLKGKQPAKRKTYQKELRRLAPQASGLMARITDEVSAYRVDGPLIAYMNHAPQGPGREARYTQGLALLVPGLDATQRSLFERVVAQLEGMYFVTEAQKERTLLALKQTKLDKVEVRTMSRTFDRQRQVIEQRFWILVDNVLDQEQRLWLWQRIPQRQKRKSQAYEHLFSLAGISPNQGARLRALNTEIEQEASPDRAFVKRSKAALSRRGKKLAGAERKQLAKQQTAAYKRLGELNRFRREATLEILTDAQWREYQAIPPRLSINERAGSYGRVLSGWKPTPRQAIKIKASQASLRAKRRDASKRMALIRREGADNGPDSPQMMAMEMQMAGAKADTAAMNRAHLGVIFTNVMTPEQVSRWVMGTWGYKR
jgi:hypothetical protein